MGPLDVGRDVLTSGGCRRAEPDSQCGMRARCRTPLCELIGVQSVITGAPLESGRTVSKAIGSVRDRFPVYALSGVQGPSTRGLSGPDWILLVL